MFLTLQFSSRCPTHTNRIGRKILEAIRNWVIQGVKRDQLNCVDISTIEAGHNHHPMLYELDLGFEAYLGFLYI